MSFTVGGAADTSGYVKINLPKSLVSNVENIKVYLDGNKPEYTVSSTANCWILKFNYYHSTHKAKIAMATTATTEPALIISLDYWVWAAAVAIILLVLGIGCVTVWQLRKM